MTEPLLVAERVRLRRGDVDVLRGAGVRVDPGEVVALAGRSGSGKSSLCHLVAGLGRPTEGRVLVGGTPADAVDDWAVVALLPQRLALVAELTVAENVRLPYRLRRGRTTDDSGELILALGLQLLAGRLATQTSLGEQQRAAIARTLVLRPRLAVLDEPTSHQDDEHVGLVLAALATARSRGIGVLVATHDERVLATADAVVELRDGAVAG